MSELQLFLAVEEAIPADHPAAWLAVPLGILFFGGSVFLLLWSNYGAKKGAAIYGVAFFGFSFLIGVFWWFGGPGIPPGLGISHLPGQAGDHYNERWYPFEEGSPRGEFFDVGDPSQYRTVTAHVGLEGVDEETVQADPGYAALTGSVGASVEGMQAGFFPVDDNGVAQIGAERRTSLEEDAVAGQPEGSRRASDFYTVEQVGEPLVREDPSTGVLLATQQFQVQATFVDDDGVPVAVVDVGEPENWYAFFDPGANWLPSALWTVISLALFLLSLLWLDRLEMREKKLLADQVEEPEDLAVPIAQ